MLTSSAAFQIVDTPDLTKQDIRVKVWNYLTDNGLGKFPLPLTNRIPNFEGCGECGHKVASLPVFSSSHTIKVNPDKPQEEVRFLALQAHKKVLVPSPRLRKGLLNLLENEGTDNAQMLRRKAQSEGVKFFSKPVDLRNKVKVDMIVIGSVAVSVTGRRIGKGEGFADLEYAMMKIMNAVDDDVPIVTTVHDCQVFDELPSRLFQDYDVPVDTIVTPTRVIHITEKLKRPSGMYWNLLSVDKFLQVPILKTIYDIAKENGVDVTLHNGVQPPDHAHIDACQVDRGRGARSRGMGAKAGFRKKSWNRDPFDVIEREGQIPDGRGREMEWGEGDSGRKEAWRRRGGMRVRGRGKGGIGRWQHYNEDEFEEALEERSWRGREGRRGRAGRWARGSSSAEEVGSTESNTGAVTSSDFLNIQVTINVSKQNKIVRRDVQETTESDRVASTQDIPEDSTNESLGSHRASFSVFVGGIPRGCRPSDLHEELRNRGVQPKWVAWKGAGSFAFLNFDAATAPPPAEVIASLEGLSLYHKTLRVDLSNPEGRRTIHGQQQSVGAESSTKELQTDALSVLEQDKTIQGSEESTIR